MHRDPVALRAGRVVFGTVLILWLILPLIPLAIWSVAHGWRFPALLPNTHVSVKPHAWTVSLAMLPAELFTSVEPNHSYLKDHDPPGLFPQRLFFSHFASRAPPSLKSL